MPHFHLPHGIYPQRPCCALVEHFVEGFGTLTTGTPPLGLLTDVADVEGNPGLLISLGPNHAYFIYCHQGKKCVLGIGEEVLEQKRPTELEWETVDDLPFAEMIPPETPFDLPCYRASNAQIVYDALTRLFSEVPLDATSGAPSVMGAGCTTTGAVSAAPGASTAIDSSK